MADSVNLLQQLYMSSDGTTRFRVFDDGTPDPTKYHDVSEVSLLQNNVSLARLVPGNHGFAGLRGVIIPRSTAEGGSLGFDHKAPQRCYIDPELTNKQICVDFSQLSKEVINQSFKQAAKEVPSDLKDRGVMAYLHMAEAVKRAEASKPAAAPQTPVETVAHAVMSFGQVPRPAATTPPQPPASPQPAPAPSPPIAPAPQSLQAAPVQSVPLSILKDVQSPARKQSMPVPQPAPQVARPTRKVLVELPKPAGFLEVRYHDVIRTDDVLILIYDHSAVGTQHVWFPSAPDTEPDANGVIPDPVPLGILVYDEAEQPDTGFIAYASGVKFRYGNFEFCLLAIEKEKSYKENLHGATQPG